MPVLERQTPTTPAHPGWRERRAPEDIRPGTRVLINALAVATGHSAWTIGTTRKATDVVAHLKRASQPLPRMPREDWLMDTLHTHWSLDGCRQGAQWCQGPFEPANAQKVRTAAPAWVSHVTAMSCIARPNTARGATKLRCC